MIRCLALLALLLVQPALAERALGTASAAQQAAGNCVLGAVLARDLCLLVTISAIPDGTVDGAPASVADTTTSLKVTHPAGGGTPTGTIVTFTGGDNSDWTENAYPTFATVAMAPAVARGQRVIQNKWNSPYWKVGNVGPLALVARSCTLLRAIYDNSSLHTKGTPFIVFGQSMGSAQIAYCLAHYGAHRYIDLAVLASGPGMERLDYLSEGASNATWLAIATPLIVGSNNTITIIAAPVDAFYGSRTYMTSKTMSGGIDNPMKDSILRGDAVLHYPRTTIKAYFGDRDDSGVVPTGRWFLRQLSTPYTETITVQPGGNGHGDVPDDSATAINADFAAATYRH